MTQEERRAAFERRAEIGRAMKEQCDADGCDIAERLQDRKIIIGDAIILAWMCGADYGANHPELLELRAFNNEKD